jgi:hypothetical protein
MPDGEVKLRAVARVFKSYSLEYNKDIRDEVFASYDEAKKGNTISSDQVDAFLKD